MLLPFLAIIFLVCLIPTGMVSLGSVAMAALYPLLTILYGVIRGYAAGDMLVCAIGSGGNYALAAARALMRHTDMTAHEIAEAALHVAASICVYTNDHITVEDV